MLIEKLQWLGNSGFRVEDSSGRIIYFDPFRLKAGAKKADVIFISHEHFDHCSPKDIALILKDSTVIVGIAMVEKKLGRKIVVVKPGDKGQAGGVEFESVAAYNIKIPNHAKGLGLVGFIATIDGERIYHAGDTDKIPEMADYRADIALLPVGGTYTMDVEQAVLAAELINPKFAVPMHYGWKPGLKSYGEDFVKKCKCPARGLPITTL